MPGCARTEKSNNKSCDRNIPPLNYTTQSVSGANKALMSRCSYCAKELEIKCGQRVSITSIVQSVQLVTMVSLPTKCRVVANTQQRRRRAAKQTDDSDSREMNESESR